MEHQHRRERLDENLLLGVDGLLLLVLGMSGVDGFLLDVRLRLRLGRQRNLHSLRMRDVRQRILNCVDLVVLEKKKKKESEGIDYQFSITSFHTVKRYIPEYPTSKTSNPPPTPNLSVLARGASIGIYHRISGL